MIVSEQLLTLFKFGLLAVLYVFFLRVLWAVRSEVAPVVEAKAPQPVPVGASAPAAAAAGSAPAATPVPIREDPQTLETPRGLLIVREPEDSAGFSFTLDNELTVGRAAGCGIAIEDTFVSQLHARVFRISNAGSFPGEVDGYHVEDLGSTNGTFLNGRRLAPNQPEHLQLADTIQVGSTVLEFV